MKIKYFIEAVKTDPDIIKCSVTLKGIRASIEPMVKKLTDTDEEYTTLMEIIPKFYRDHYHKDYEEMQCHTYEYTEYLYDEDDEPLYDEDGNQQTKRSVDVYTSRGQAGTGRTKMPLDEDSDYVHKYPGILLGIHNHPNNSSSFQSSGDWINQAKFLVKFGVSCGDDGIDITKMNARDYDTVDGFSFDFHKTVWGYERNREKAIWAAGDTNGANQIQKDYEEGKITPEEADSKLHDVLHTHLKTHGDDERKTVNKIFNSKVSIFKLPSLKK